MKNYLAALWAIWVLCLVLVIVGCDTTRQKPARQKATSQKPLTPPTLVAGTAMTWTDGTQTWAGNPFCGASATLLSLNSPAVDRGTLISGFHCPKPGSALNQPRMSNGDYCQEWYGSSPDLGSCEYVPTARARTVPRAQSNTILK